MKMNSRFQRISIVAFVAVSLLSVVACARHRVDFSAPEKTIETYYVYHAGENAYNKAVVTDCFYPLGRYSGGLDRWWSEFEIVEQRPTDKAGDSYSPGVVISPEAVEIIVEVKMVDPAKGNPKTKFWYLLQNFAGVWKIVGHSYIPDENYPPID